MQLNETSLSNSSSPLKSFEKEDPNANNQNNSEERKERLKIVFK